MGRKAKTEVQRETALRTLFTSSLAEAIKEDDLKIPKKEQAEIVEGLLNTAGAAIDQLVDSFVDLALGGEDEDGDEDGDEDEGGDEDEDED